MANKQRYSTSPADNHASVPQQAESHGNSQPPMFSRRSFLRTAGFAIPAALASCRRAPVEHAIPFLVQPEEVVPGTSLWYASTCMACEAACGLLVKNRDGRPIKLEGNPHHPLSQGGLCARGQAAVLELYDERRLSGPLWGGKPASWEAVDAAVLEALESIRQRTGNVRLLTATVVSPTVQRAIDTFLARFPNGSHVVYDPTPYAAILDAHEKTHGLRALPHYLLERAEVIVSFEADFLGTWLAPVEFAAAWQRHRRPTPQHPHMSYHVQIEARLSLTGCKADRRYALPPSQIPAAVFTLLAAVEQLASGKKTTLPPCGLPPEEVEALAEKLWRNRGQCLVLCGRNDRSIQIACNRLNQLLEAYGNTMDLQRPSRQASGSDQKLRLLMQELAAGAVDALFIAGVNPVYELQAGKPFGELLRSVPLVVSFARWEDETSRVAHFVCPDSHPLESWGDAEPVAGVVSVCQPAVAPLGHTRQLIESLSLWSGNPRSAYDIVRETWRELIYPRAQEAEPFESFWRLALERGVVELKSPALQPTPVAFSEPWVFPQPATDGTHLELVLYASVSQGDGRHALNPWLHELPDPITKVTWDNYASVAPQTARRFGLRQGDVVRLERVDGGAVVELPVFLQPGQAEGTVAVALGYGRAGSERFAALGPRWIGAPPLPASPPPVGVNMAPFVQWSQDGLRQLEGSRVRILPTGKRRPLACTQTHHSLEVPEHLALPGGEVREPVRRCSLSAVAAGIALEEHEPHPTLWPEDHPFQEHHWGLAIDCNACTGCSACVIACQAENNIPVVGRHEVLRGHEMHWLRIDTYFTEESGTFRAVHQPMLCQQCDNAPCESVCPVLATVTSSEGLAEQVYNRCIGTRYCANNCPYKVRRFNWFNYHPQRSRTDLVLNPDVTVRTRGVMEKCSFCVQRITEAKIQAKTQGRPLADGDIKLACEQSCPTKAIVFGDRNDPKSRLAALRQDPRSYTVLGELGIRPSVVYLAVVENEEEHRG